MRFPLSDLHIHSLASGHAFNTIDEIITYSSNHGYQVIGIAEHGPDMEGAPHAGYFEMLYRLPHEEKGMKILYGCEANILDIDGHIDIPDELTAALDYVMAGLHRRTSYHGTSTAEHVRAIVSLIRSGKADIVSHPIAPTFLADPKIIVKAAYENKVILECNKSVMREAVLRGQSDVICLTAELLKCALDMGVEILLGSDAHYISEMEISIEEQRMLHECYHISFEDMLNSYPKRLVALLEQRKQLRRKNCHGS